MRVPGYFIENSRGNRVTANTLAEAEEIFFEMCNDAEFVRIAYKEDGHIITVRKSW